MLWESHLVLDLTNLLLDILLSPGSPRSEGSTAEVMSAYLELHIARNPNNERRATVRNALSKGRNLSKIVHDDVFKAECLGVYACLDVGLASCLFVPGELVEPAHAPCDTKTAAAR
jgi:hypothetical protein